MSMSSLEGRTIGHYRLLSKIGAGGMGEVYLATDNNVKREVAVKVVSMQLSGQQTDQQVMNAVKNFQREARAVARMQHPHILALYEYAEEMIDGRKVTYMVIPYCAAGSLAGWIKRYYGSNQPLPVSDVVHFIKQAADALQYAHDEKIIHQDVKPDNFLLLKRHSERLPDLLLADFGVASLMSATVSITNVVGGSPLFMAPEQFSNKPVFATDQYALAMIAYSFLTGRYPFDITTIHHLMYQHANVKPTLPSKINNLLSYQIDEVVLQGLAKAPEKRFPSIMEFANQLEKAARQQTHSVNISTEKGRQETSNLQPTHSPHTSTIHIPVDPSSGVIKEFNLNTLQLPVLPITGSLVLLDVIAFFIIPISLRILILAILILLEFIVVIGMVLYNTTREKTGNERKQ